MITLSCSEENSLDFGVQLKYRGHCVAKLQKYFSLLTQDASLSLSLQFKIKEMEEECKRNRRYVALHSAKHPSLCQWNGRTHTIRDYANLIQCTLYTLSL
jgi:hypothetical protein